MARAKQGDQPDLCLDEPCPATRRSFLATMAALIGPAASAQDIAEDRGKSAARLEVMRRLAKEVKVREIIDGKAGPPLPLRPEPLLRYSNPLSHAVDGTLWRWGERGRPAAVLKLGLRGPAPGQRFWNLNVSALSPKTIEVEFGDGRRWSSRPPGELQPRAVPDAPAPAGSPAQRLTQARAIARRFSVSLQAPKPGRIQQRLLTQPLDRYDDPAAGLLHGMLFAFVGATNPNVLLILEAWSEDAGSRAWRYAFARLSNVEETALLDGKQVWNVPLISTPANVELYMGRPMRARTPRSKTDRIAGTTTLVTPSERLRHTFEGDVMTRVIGQDPPDVRLDEPHPATRRSFLAMMAALIGPAASAQDDPEDRGKSTARLEAMRRLAKGIKVCEITDGKPGPPLALRPEPLLRYSSPGWNVVDGALWSWGEPGRPAALIKAGLRGPTRAQLSWHSSITVLSPKRVEVEFRDGLRWSSRPPELTPTPVPDAPAPADSAAHRLLQAKDIARRLSASTETPNPRGRVQLRLLPRPIDRYSDATAGLLDGLLFDFVSLSSPAVLVVLEARSEHTGVRTWRYAFARQGAGESIVLLDGKRVWGAPSVVPPANTELYMGRPLPDSAVE